MEILWAGSSCQALSTRNPESGRAGSWWGLLGDVLTNLATPRPCGHQKDAQVRLPAAHCRVRISQSSGSPVPPDPAAAHAGQPPAGGRGTMRPGAALCAIPQSPPQRLGPHHQLPRVAHQALGSHRLPLKPEDDRGLCGGVGACPSVGCGRRAQGCTQGRRRFQSYGGSPFHFSPFPALYSPSRPLAGCETF